MPNTRELRRRIKSVKNISQITKAMQMVAATKMRRAQTQALAGRPYSNALNEALNRLLAKVDSTTHPLLKMGLTGEVSTVILSTSKPLCGALNTNLFRAIANTKELLGGTFFTIGSKAQNFVVKTGKKLEADFENTEVVNFHQAKVLGKLLINKYLKGEIKEVYLSYPKFISTLRQEPTIERLLPVSLAGDVELKQSLTGNNQEYIFEPTPLDLLDSVLTHIVEVKIYQALLETKASEHSARMIAMQNATDNAKELVEDLNLNYNQTRQNGITQELLEITTAAAALQ